MRVWSPIEEAPDRLKHGYYGTGTITSAHGEWIVDDATHLLPLPAADITGDGQPEAMFAVQTGGSHCCSGIALYSLGDAPKLLLRVTGGGGIGAVISGVRDLDGDGVYELLGRLFVSGPCVWPSVQLILQFDGQGYVQAGQSLRPSTRLRSPSSLGRPWQGVTRRSPVTSAGACWRRQDVGLPAARTASGN